LHTLGIDIGSASSKAVIVLNGRDIIASSLILSGAGTSGPLRAWKETLDQAGLSPRDIARSVATGYGRRNFQSVNEQVSEITCHAVGVHHLTPGARTIIDIGGQDAKVIRIDPAGIVNDFLMNEKCAAGTGRFLEVMARVLECDIGELAELGANAARVIDISSTCTVFAESEVISQLADGKARPDVAAGSHKAVARRVAGMVGRIGVVPEVIITGGVAINAGVVRALELELKVSIEVSPWAQLTGAIGAALLAYRRLS
jgi:(R)-2-hydroxyacyl-CoA dehydratese activating ATPase